VGTLGPSVVIALFRCPASAKEDIQAPVSDGDGSGFVSLPAKLEKPVADVVSVQTGRAGWAEISGEAGKAAAGRRPMNNPLERIGDHGNSPGKSCLPLCKHAAICQLVATKGFEPMT
jgi:hypothetical protein